MSRVTATIKDTIKVGSNLQAHLKDLRTRMLKAAENLDFEEAATIRDEVKRLESVEMAVASDPMIRQSTLDDINSSSSKRGRSTAGKGGTRVFRGKSVKKF